MSVKCIIDDRPQHLRRRKLKSLGKLSLRNGAREKNDRRHRAEKTRRFGKRHCAIGLRKRFLTYFKRSGWIFGDAFGEKKKKKKKKNRNKANHKSPSKTRRKIYRALLEPVPEKVVFLDP